MSRENKHVRIGLVGYGNFGQLYATTITRLAEASLDAIVDTDTDCLENARALFPDVECADCLDSTVAEPSIDAWVVASSTASHVVVCEAVLRAGKFALVEKPIATNLKNALQLGTIVSLHPGQLMMGHVVLFNSEFQQLARECAARSAICFIDAVRHRPATTIDAYPGESPFALTMVHDLYCVQALLNRAEPYQLSAQIRRRDDGAIDLALAQLGFPNGCCVSLSASYLTPPGMPSDGFDRMEVFGDNWAARVAPNPRPLEVWDDRSRHPLTLELGSDHASGMLAAQLRQFCRVIRGEAEIPVGATYGDAIQVQRWIDQLEGIAVEIR